MQDIKKSDIRQDEMPKEVTQNEVTKNRSRACKNKTLLKIKPDIYKYKCDLCNYNSVYRNNLVTHKRNMHNCSSKMKKKFECEICSYKTNEALYLNRHIIESHTGREFQCASCEFATSYKTVLVRHMSLVHPCVPFENQDYICHVCEYKTKYPYLLKRHFNKHTREKIFSCELCDFLSIHKRSFRRHMAIVHMSSPNQSKKFVCEICKFATDDKRQFEIHINKHNRKEIFKCDFCDFTTVYKQNLCKHEIRLHNRSPCKMTDRWNRWRNKLKMRDKKCKFCNFVTYTTNMLIRHVGCKHPSEDILESEFLVDSAENQVPGVIQTNVKAEEDILETGAIELQYIVKDEVDEVIERNLSDID